jgi:hypothetical protein
MERSLPKTPQHSVNTPQGMIQFGTFDFKDGKPIPTYLEESTKKGKKPSTKKLLEKAVEAKERERTLQQTEEGKVRYLFKNLSLQTHF